MTRRSSQATYHGLAVHIGMKAETRNLGYELNPYQKTNSVHVRPCFIR